ncbi:hypothetical protein [Oligoflexus tunisiensis]|uniref:hypothetical protein n=1 Tax=Oligoflexus tunisiensis TaxID=708132 RepID=UPI001C404659|nr:hypothetical protein [Oligoflexus tunisiensis]
MGIAPVGIDKYKEQLAAGAYVEYEMKFGFSIGGSANWQNGYERGGIPILKLFSGDVLIPVPFTDAVYKIGIGYGRFLTRLHSTDGEYEFRSVFLRYDPSIHFYMDALRIGQIVKPKESNRNPIYKENEIVIVYLFLMGFNFW